MSELSEFHLNGAWVVLSDDWLDISDEWESEEAEGLENPEGSILLQKENGAGVLSVTVMPWREPLDMDELRRLQRDMCSKGSEEVAFDHIEREEPTMMAAASFQDAELFNRVWYCSDGETVALLVYTCEGEPDPDEVAECEQIASDLWFGPDEEIEDEDGD